MSWTEQEKRRLLAEGHIYKANHPQRIPLRAMRLRWPGAGYEARPNAVQGIALPDGRFIFSGNQTYSSEAVMLKLNPGAIIEWAPGADAAINHVMELPE